MLMSCAVEEARVVKGQKALAVEAFGRALRQIPTILADNAGYDSADMVAKLRAVHHEGFKDAGLDMEHGTIRSMKQLGVTESSKLKRLVVLSASEAAEMIIRVDNILRAAPRKRFSSPFNHISLSEDDLERRRSDFGNGFTLSSHLSMNAASASYDTTLLALIGVLEELNQRREMGRTELAVDCNGLSSAWYEDQTIIQYWTEKGIPAAGRLGIAIKDGVTNRTIHPIPLTMFIV
ncbi:hypothetical protein AX14_014450 [Amanita brunnescens Koide BX004]|nr:hypothetical protein AX14_014450 [Amanita brunnescens Koide BX004]